MEVGLVWMTLLHYNYVHAFVPLYLGLHIFSNVNLSMFNLDT